MITFLVGATGVGKSEVALRLAEEAGGVILSMDSMQVYRGLDIGTGKPTAAERARVVHGGLDLAPWWEAIDTGKYLAAAAEFLRTAEGRPVFIVGGTGLYFRALTRGMSEAPAAPIELRAELSRLSLSELQVRLRRIDPGVGDDFEWENPRRLQRAIEVMESTGMPLRQWHAEQNARSGLSLVPTFRAFFLQRERDDLRERIAARVRGMLENGWMEEVRGLIAERGAEAVKGCAAIGYGVIAEALETGDFSETAERITTETRQYAKRQLTWFRRELALESVMISISETAEETTARVKAFRS